jgi:hypothetical protein
MYFCTIKVVFKLSLFTAKKHADYEILMFLEVSICALYIYIDKIDQSTAITLL